jgi:hypothetical protein
MCRSANYPFGESEDCRSLGRPRPAVVRVDENVRDTSVEQGGNLRSSVIVLCAGAVLFQVLYVAIFLPLADRFPPFHDLSRDHPTPAHGPTQMKLYTMFTLEYIPIIYVSVAMDKGLPLPDIQSLSFSDCCLGLQHYKKLSGSMRIWGDIPDERNIDTPRVIYCRLSRCLNKSHSSADS